VWVHDLRDADASCGGKAVGLARLIAAGLPVPEGFVIDGGAFRAIVGDLTAEVAGVGHLLEETAKKIAGAELPELRAEVERRAAALGSLVAVRSSATIEDGAAGAAAGVYSSRRAVPAADVWEAIRAVWTSALTPLAAAYARRRGGTIAIAVIVQRFADGERATIYSRPPGHPGADEMLVQRGEHLSRVPRDARAAAVEAAIGADADIELVGDMIVQARPIVHPQPKRLAAAPPMVLAALDDGRVWTWDVAHNPDPLSTAQQELVARVDAAGVAPYSLRVCAGFLYYAPREAVKPAPVRDEAELVTRAYPLERRLAQLVADPPASVDDALARYLDFYRVWAGELAPLIARAREVLPAALRARGNADPEAAAAALALGRASASETILYAAARGDISEHDAIDKLGALAPAWDVAVPTFGERPRAIVDAIARAADGARDGSVTRGARAVAMTKDQAELATEIQLAGAAADLAERDDFMFARAQNLVRRALLARARELGLPDESDIFWLPIAAINDHAFDPDDAHRRARAARAAAARAAGWQMPLVVGAPPAPAKPSLHGVGTGPRVSGRVVRFASLASAISVGAGDVVVTRAVTPALAVLVVGCAALVSETGGLLDHGAALARELGIPCVVGCHEAWSLLADGMIVTVDGDRGLVSTTAS
jgi:pyruvate,water dikinase